MPVPVRAFLIAPQPMPAAFGEHKRVRHVYQPTPTQTPIGIAWHPHIIGEASGV